MARMYGQNNRRTSLSTASSDDDASSQNSDYSSDQSRPVRYLTPQKYRQIEHTQVKNIFSSVTPNNHQRSPTDYSSSPTETNHTLTPTQYRLPRAFSSFTFSHDNDEKPCENKPKIVHKRSPVAFGEFILTKKPVQDNSIYNYQPKRTALPLLYKGITNGAEVQQRACDEIKQYIIQRSRSPSPTVKHRSTSQHNEATRSENPSIAPARDVIHKTVSRHSQSSITLTEQLLFHQEFPKQTFIPSYPVNVGVPIDRYYFGEGSEDIKVEEVDFLPSIMNKSIDQSPPWFARVEETILQEVVDSGTITDNISPEQDASGWENQSPAHYIVSPVPTRAASVQSNNPPLKTSTLKCRPTTSTIDSSGDHPASYANEPHFYEFESSISRNTALNRLTEHESEEEDVKNNIYDNHDEDTEEQQKELLPDVNTSHKQNTVINPPPYQPFQRDSLAEPTPSSELSIADTTQPPKTSRLTRFFDFFRRKKKR